MRSGKRKWCCSGIYVKLSLDQTNTDLCPPIMGILWQGKPDQKLCQDTGLNSVSPISQIAHGWMQKAEMLLGVQLVAKCPSSEAKIGRRCSFALTSRLRKGLVQPPWAGHQGRQGADWLAESVRRRQRVGCRLSFDCEFPGNNIQKLWVKKNKHGPKEAKDLQLLLFGAKTKNM
jgi:hypothetical protein